MKRRTKNETPTPAGPPAEVEIGGVRFALHVGLLGTFRAVELRHLDDLRKAYMGLTGCDGAAAMRVSYALLKGAVGGAVQEAWYKHYGKPISPRMAQAQQQRLADAAAAAAPPAPQPEGQNPSTTAQGTESVTASPPPVGPKKSGKKAAIRGLIAEGKTDDEIFAALQPAYPNMIRSDVTWTRRHPLKESA